MDLVALLKESYNNFSKSNKKVADFLIQDPEAFLSYSSMQIGEKSGTSSATVVRFARKLGFHGLDELKIEVAKNFLKLEVIDSLNPIFSKDDTLAELTSKLFDKVDSSIKAINRSVDIAILSDAIDIISKASMIYLYGIGASSLAAQDLYHKFNRSGIKSVFNFDTHMGVEVSYHANNDDVLICFSYSGNTKEIIFAAEQASKNGANIIVITRNKSSRLAEYADIILLVPDTEELVRIGAISSKYTTMILADLLFLGVVKLNYCNIEPSFIETSKLAQKLKF